MVFAIRERNADALTSSSSPPFDSRLPCPPSPRRDPALGAPCLPIAASRRAKIRFTALWNCGPW